MAKSCNHISCCNWRPPWSLVAASAKTDLPLCVCACAGALAPQTGPNPQGAFNMLGSAVEAAGSVATAGQVGSQLG